MAQSMPARRDQQPITLPAMPFKVVEPGMLSTNQLDASAVTGENEPVNRSEARSLLDSVLDLHAQGESPLASHTENILRIDAADPRHAGVVPAVKQHWHDAKRPDERGSARSPAAWPERVDPDSCVRAKAKAPWELGESGAGRGTERPEPQGAGAAAGAAAGAPRAVSAKGPQAFWAAPTTEAPAPPKDAMAAPVPPQDRADAARPDAREGAKAGAARLAAWKAKVELAEREAEEARAALATEQQLRAALEAEYAARAARHDEALARSAARVGELQEALAQAEAAEAARAAAAEREMGALRAHQAAVEQRVVRQQEERLQAAQRQHEGLLRGAAAEGKEAAARAEALAAELEEWRGGARVSELEAAAEADRGRAEAATQERDAAVQARDEAETARAIAEALAAQAEEARAAHNEAMEKRMIEAEESLNAFLDKEKAAVSEALAAGATEVAAALAAQAEAEAERDAALAARDGALGGVKSAFQTLRDNVQARLVEIDAATEELRAARTAIDEGAAAAAGREKALRDDLSQRAAQLAALQEQLEAREKEVAALEGAQGTLIAQAAARAKEETAREAEREARESERAALLEEKAALEARLADSLDLSDQASRQAERAGVLMQEQEQEMRQRTETLKQGEARLQEMIQQVEAEQARVVELEAAHAADRGVLAAEREAVAAERKALSEERGAAPPRATGAAATDADLNHRLIMAIQSLREEESKTRALRATNTELMARLEQLERTGQALGGGTGGADVRDLIESNRRLRQELTVKNQQAEERRVQLSAANDTLLSLREQMGRPGAQPPAAPRESKSFEEIEALAEQLLAEGGDSDAAVARVAEEVQRAIAGRSKEEVFLDVTSAVLRLKDAEARAAALGERVFALEAAPRVAPAPAPAQAPPADAGEFYRESLDLLQLQNADLKHEVEDLKGRLTLAESMAVENSATTSAALARAREAWQAETRALEAKLVAQAARDRRDAELQLQADADTARSNDYLAHRAEKEQLRGEISLLTDKIGQFELERAAFAVREKALATELEERGRMAGRVPVLEKTQGQLLSTIASLKEALGVAAGPAAQAGAQQGGAGAGTPQGSPEKGLMAPANTPIKPAVVYSAAARAAIEAAGGTPGKSGTLRDSARSRHSEGRGSQ